MKLIAVTYNYIEDNKLCNKIVGIFNQKDIENAIETIKSTYGKDKKVKHQTDNGKNFYLEFDNGDWFYSGTFVVGELNF